MKKVYVFDFIGIHSGMHYYNEAFKKALGSQSHIEIEILSNYSEKGKRPFICNLYLTNRINAIIQIIKAYFKLLSLLFNKDNNLIILSYGDCLDLFFLTLSFFTKKVIIDVHEVYALRLKENDIISRLLLFIYTHFVRVLIYHSERSKEILNRNGFSGKMFYIPHFKYCFLKTYNIDNVDSSVLTAFDKGKINILYFGNISFEKGIDVLINASNSMKPDVVAKYNFVIAGKDSKNIIRNLSNKFSCSYHLVIRHINDDELVYLYEHTDYVILPYRKTTQSGVMEMACYFRKPILASNIPYFKEVLDKYPSFGILFNLDTNSLTCLLENDLLYSAENEYYKDNEVKSFTEEDIYKKFSSDFSDYLNSY